MYDTAGSHQYLFIMSAQGINLLANSHSPQIMPVFPLERFCSTLRAAQLFNGAIKNSGSHGPLDMERPCKAGHQIANHDMPLPLPLSTPLSPPSLHLCLSLPPSLSSSLYLTLSASPWLYLSVSVSVSSSFSLCFMHVI